MRSIQKQLTPGHELSCDLHDELPNEFTGNADIIYGSFRHLLPLGESSKLIGGGSVPGAVTRRLMRFYDPLFAKDAAFRNILFSQRMRHGVCQRVAKLKGNKKLR